MRRKRSGSSSLTTEGECIPRGRPGRPPARRARPLRCGAGRRRWRGRARCTAAGSSVFLLFFFNKEREKREREKEVERVRAAASTRVFFFPTWKREKKTRKDKPASRRRSPTASTRSPGASGTTRRGSPACPRAMLFFCFVVKEKRERRKVRGSTPLLHSLSLSFSFPLSHSLIPCSSPGSRS